jgi:hypothetical protein
MTPLLGQRLTAIPNRLLTFYAIDHRSGVPVSER